MLDAVKFSYKVYAQNDSRKYGDYIFILIVILNLKPNSINWYDDCLPIDVFISIFDRLGFYTETGFLLLIM